ncbi:MAG: hypothetical protein LBH80_04030 [Prevotellaceae bacterium]|nr:hypothetical protein [Prevotellaceae bacterium]
MLRKIRQFITTLTYHTAIAASNEEEVALYVSPEQQEIIKFTFTPVDKTIKFGITAKYILVDWGDGSRRAYNNLNKTPIAHTYTNRAVRTVRILEAEAITNFNCTCQQLTALDVSNCTTLITLSCWGNLLGALDVSKNTTLKSLVCSNNPLNTLDVSKNSALLALSCRGNQLRSLDISANTALTELWCPNNPLNMLDVSKNRALTALDCSGGRLRRLDVSTNPKLAGLSCYSNQLNALALDSIFTDLPNLLSKEKGEIIIGNNPGADACDRRIAIFKNWNVREYW